MLNKYKNFKRVVKRKKVYKSHHKSFYDRLVSPLLKKRCKLKFLKWEDSLSEKNNDLFIFGLEKKRLVNRYIECQKKLIPAILTVDKRLSNFFVKFPSNADNSIISALALPYSFDVLDHKTLPTHRPASKLAPIVEYGDVPFAANNLIYLKHLLRLRIGKRKKKRHSTQHKLHIALVWLYEKWKREDYLDLKRRTKLRLPLETKEEKEIKTERRKVQKIKLKIRVLSLSLTKAIYILMLQKHFSTAASVNRYVFSNEYALGNTILYREHRHYRLKHLINILHINSQTNFLKALLWRRRFRPRTYKFKKLEIHKRKDRWNKAFTNKLKKNILILKRRYKKLFKSDASVKLASFNTVKKLNKLMAKLYKVRKSKRKTRKDRKKKISFTEKLIKNKKHVNKTLLTKLTISFPESQKYRLIKSGLINTNYKKMKYMRSFSAIIKKKRAHYKTDHLRYLGVEFFTQALPKPKRVKVIRNYTLTSVWSKLRFKKSKTTIVSNIAKLNKPLSFDIFSQKHFFESNSHNINFNAFKYIHLTVKKKTNKELAKYFRLNITFKKTYQPLWFKKIGGYLVLVEPRSNTVHVINKNINFIVLKISNGRGNLVYKISQNINLAHINFINIFMKNLKTKAVRLPFNFREFIVPEDPEKDNCWFKTCDKLPKPIKDVSEWRHTDLTLGQTLKIWRAVWYILSSKGRVLGNLVYSNKYFNSLLSKDLLKNKKLHRRLVKHEIRSFRWKFYKKKWYFMHSKWKQSIVFKAIIKKAWNNYRKIAKNFLFIKIFHVHIFYVFGISINDLKLLWCNFRRGFDYSSNTPTAQRLFLMLQLKLDNLPMLLGLAPNRLVAQEFVRFGGFKVNGMSVTNHNFIISVGDVLQINIQTYFDIKPLRFEKHLISLKIRLRYMNFFYPLWSIMAFIIIRWPYTYELVEESILTERWLRFYVRYYPVRIIKFRHPKIKWLKY